MLPTSTDTAELIRSHLQRSEASPASVRTMLDRVPREDRDAWLDLVLDVEDIDDGPDLPRRCVPYLPCAVSTVLAAIDQARVTAEDVLVDVGAGIGRALFLAHLVTGASSIGIEIQASLIERARQCAEALHLTRLRFLHADAADLAQLAPGGTVFFFYCPFSGERLERVLDDLHHIARAHPIRVCCVDMAPLERPWLRRLDARCPELDVYQSD